MKNLFHKLFSLTMVFLLLLLLLLLLSTISWTDGPIEDKKPCCDNEVFTMQGQDDLTYHETDLDFPIKIFLYSYASTYVGLFVETEYDILCNVNPHPILTEDLHILHEVFLI